jgi:thiamine pyrophosphokinase
MVFLLPRCIIFANGTLPDPDSARRLIRDTDVILAADGGTHHARTLGLLPSIVVGDFDSLDPADRAALESAGTRFIQHPRDKDETDLELALNQAIELGHREIVILGALGLRLDQTLGNLSLLSATRPPSSVLRLDDGVEQAFFCRGQARVEGRRGDLVSLIPWGGEVTGVRTQGLRWPLSNETLFPHKTRGISNELLGEAAQIQIQSGLLLIVHRRLKPEN